jgi:hypothetical protein
LSAPDFLSVFGPWLAQERIWLKEYFGEENCKLFFSVFFQAEQGQKV